MPLSTHLTPENITEFFATSLASMAGSTLGTWATSALAATLFTAGSASTPAVLTGTFIGSILGAATAAITVRCYIKPSDTGTSTILTTSVSMLVFEVVGTAVSPALGVPYAVGSVLGGVVSLLCGTPTALLCINASTQDHDNDDSLSHTSSVEFNDAGSTGSEDAITNLRELLLGTHHPVEGDDIA